MMFGQGDRIVAVWYVGCVLVNWMAILSHKPEGEIVVMHRTKDQNGDVLDDRVFTSEGRHALCSETRERFEAECDAVAAHMLESMQRNFGGEIVHEKVEVNGDPQDMVLALQSREWAKVTMMTSAFGGEGVADA